MRYYDNTPDLKLINIKTDHRCLGSDYESFNTFYEFVNENLKPYDRGRIILVEVRKGIGSQALNYNVFKATGTKYWQEFENQDKLKKEIVVMVKNWFDFNNIPWNTTDQ